MKRAFTLIELLVVIAIIAILSAILFPVFAMAKQAAKRTVEISNFKQAATGTALYTADYDGTFMMSNSGGNPRGWGFGPPDAVPDQVMAPYIKNTKINIDPLDPMQSEDDRIKDQIRAGGWNSTVTPEQKAYALAVRSNIGYNYAFFSPWRVVNGYVGSASTAESEVGHPAETLMWGSSIWNRDAAGNPIGGGNWVIETPCWLDSSGNTMNPMQRYQADRTLQSYPTGWSTSENSWTVYGGLWPFYNQTNRDALGAGLRDGIVVMGFADGHVQAKNLGYATQGCSAYGQGFRKGTVTDKDKFIWDSE